MPKQKKAEGTAADNGKKIVALLVAILVLVMIIALPLDLL